jgi:mRNA-degrading endonuclease RelE of RelBE toxin-antitoxin system
MDQSEADRITLALQAFALESRGDVKALKGALKGRHRLRVGKWRAILSLSHDRVVVLSIDNRGEAY